ncbi:unnamed protein product [Gordionus sp. m RMFG-2023]|uniref:plexin-A4-like n=1 Tax=Gordionus sp. m RMFG-2023 TaxID=3053472 RepID=UPI0030E0CEE8
MACIINILTTLYFFGVINSEDNNNVIRFKVDSLKPNKGQHSLKAFNHLVTSYYNGIPLIFVTGIDVLLALDGRDLSLLDTVDLSFSSLCKYYQYEEFCSKIGGVSSFLKDEQHSTLISTAKTNYANFNKLLLIDRPTQGLIVCGTFGGFCQSLSINFEFLAGKDHPKANKNDLRASLNFTQLSTTPVISEYIPSSTLGIIINKPMNTKMYSNYVHKEDAILAQNTLMYVGETYLGDKHKIWSEFQSSSISLRYPNVKKSKNQANSMSSNGFFLANDGIKGGQSRLQILKDFNHIYKILFQYAFQADSFAYFINVQPALDVTNYHSSPELSKQGYHSKISRVCLNDDSFHTYVELPLECYINNKEVPNRSFSNSKFQFEESNNKNDQFTLYPLLKRAFFGNLGDDLSFLSNEYGIHNSYNYNRYPYNDDAKSRMFKRDKRALIGIFVKGKDSISNSNYNTGTSNYMHRNSDNAFKPNDEGNGSTEDYAICIYPFTEIQNMFAQNIQMCYNGTFRTRGLNHINPGNPKCIISETIIGNDFCDTTKPNPRLEGRVPLKSLAIFNQVRSNYTVTALTIGVSNTFTTAFIGTNNGYLKKILLEENSKIYSSQKLDSISLSIKKDIFIDVISQNIYAMTKHKLYKIKLASCNEYTDCLGCMRSGDPYCGWCTHDNKCSLQSECITTSIFNKWLPYRSEQCIYFNAINPSKAELTQMIKIHLNISHLPSLITSKSKYYCVFDESTSIEAVIQDWGLICSLPAFDERPIIDSSLGFTQVPLKIYSDHFKNKILASQVFTFYDCSHLTSCKECTSTKWNCNWCLYENACVYQNQPCKTKNTKGNIRSSERCPKFDYNFSPNILIPHKIPTEITIKGKNLPISLGEKIEFSCLIEYNNQSVYVKAHTDKNFNYIYCKAKQYYYEEDSPQMDGILSVFWNDHHLIDRVQITLYKCENLAEDCTLCSNLDPIYKCIWCPTEKISNHSSALVEITPHGGRFTKSSCSHSHQCHLNPAFKNFENNNLHHSKCPAPLIISAYPLYGPKEGGTLITLLGHDLMKNYDQEISITIGDSPCLIENFEISRKIICRTTSSSKTGSNPLKLGNQSPSVAKINFDYMDIDVYSITPEKGPMSGGTVIKIIGKNIDVGSQRKIYFDYIPCHIIKDVEDSKITENGNKEMNVLHCLTQPVSSAPLKINSLKLEVDRFEKSISIDYVFMPDPVINSIYPLESFMSGGRKIYISGNSLNIVSNAYIFLDLNRFNIEYMARVKCNIINSTIIICLSPPLPYLITSNYTNEITFGLIMDNVVSLRNISSYYSHLPSKLTYYPDPKFYPFSEHDNVKIFTGESIIIEGANMRWLDDIKVMIGFESCPITLISDSRIVCVPPPKEALIFQPYLESQESSGKDMKFNERLMIQNEKVLPVWLTFGDIKVDIGYIKYLPLNSPIIARISNKPPKSMLVFITIAGLFLFAISLVIFFVFNRRSRLAEKEYKRIQIQMETLESNVRSECKQAFAELQTDMSDVSNDIILSGIPFFDRKTYISKIFFSEMNHYERNILFGSHPKEEIKRNPYQMCTNLLDQHLSYGQQNFSNGQGNVNGMDNFNGKKNNFATISKNFHSNSSSNKTPLLIDLSSSSISSKDASISSDITVMLDEKSNNNINDYCDKKDSTNNIFNVDHFKSSLDKEAIYPNNQNIAFKTYIPSFDITSMNLFQNSSAMKSDNNKNLISFGSDGLRNIAIFGEDHNSDAYMNPLAMSKFKDLLFNKTFLSNFITILESQPNFTVKDKTRLASLLSTLFLENTEYNVEILMTLLDKLIQSNVQSHYNPPHLFLRRTESVVEKMLTNCLSLYMYDYLKENVGSPFFYLYKALKYQIDKGPVDAITYDARYSLSEDRLLVDKVDYKTLNIYVVYGEDKNSQTSSCKVNDCDTISQVKNKLLETLYKNTPYSYRPYAEDLDLIWKHGKYGPFIMKDEDNTSLVDEYNKNRVRLNTLQHYRVNEGTTLILAPIQINPYESIASKIPFDSPNPKILQYNQYTMEQGGNHYDHLQTSSKATYFNTMNNKSQLINHYGGLTLHKKYQTNSHNDKKFSKNIAPTYWHLINHRENLNEKGSSNNTTNNIISEIFLTRLLSTKGTIQKFVDDFFKVVLSTNTQLPCFVKYLFDYLDFQAERLNIADPAVVHSWKNNCLPLRFWVNIIKNPDFIFDVNKTHTIDSSLSVLAQTFMDSCSTSELRLGKDSPSNKLLYAKEIPNYRKYLQKFYADIKAMRTVKDSELRESMSDISKKHNWNINYPVVIYQIIQYALMYKIEILEGLELNFACKRSDMSKIFLEITNQSNFGSSKLINTSKILTNNIGFYDTIDKFSVKNKNGYTLLPSVSSNLNTNLIEYQNSFSRV